jgi:hypothetical protein
MASPDDDMIKGFLQALESTLDACDRVSTVAGQLLASQRDGKPLAPERAHVLTVSSSRNSQGSERTCATQSRSGGR